MNGWKWIQRRIRAVLDQRPKQRRGTAGQREPLQRVQQVGNISSFTAVLHCAVRQRCSSLTCYRMMIMKVCVKTFEGRTALIKRVGERKKCSELDN